ncbi:hypothetical protein PBV88_53625, partial [Streptomyces sp. T21Q-yed]|nr:hypothetical protein [Streptomyces sp. T21Q-yed]
AGFVLACAVAHRRRAPPALHGRLLDDVMPAWEQQLFGAHPNLLLGGLASRPLTEVLSLSYSSSYLYFVLPPAYFLAEGPAPQGAADGEFRPRPAPVFPSHVAGAWAAAPAGMATAALALALTSRFTDTAASADRRRGGQ